MAKWTFSRVTNQRMTAEQEREVWRRFDIMQTRMDETMAAMNDVFAAAFPRDPEDKDEK